VIPLVNVWCKVRGCGRLLDVVESAPVTEDGWAGYVFVHICPQHGEGGGRGNIAAWQERQRRAGKDPGRRQTGRWAPWAELRPAVEKARRTGRTQPHPV
jgi:hypothetical protein